MLAGPVAESGVLLGSASKGDGHARVPRVFPARAVNDDARASDCSLQAQRVHTRGASVGTFVQQAQAILMTGTYEHVLIGLRCAPDSELSAEVVHNRIAIRITAHDDLMMKSTTRVLHRLTRPCRLYDIGFDIWVSIPCAAGLPFRRINAAKGFETGDIQLASALIGAAVPLCGHSFRVGGGFSWERSAGNESWDRDDVPSLFPGCETITCKVSTAAVGQVFYKRANDPSAGTFYVRKRWRAETTRPKLAEVLKPTSTRRSCHILQPRTSGSVVARSVLTARTALCCLPSLCVGRCGRPRPSSCRRCFSTLCIGCFRTASPDCHCGVRWSGAPLLCAQPKLKNLRQRKRLQKKTFFEPGVARGTCRASGARPSGWRTSRSARCWLAGCL